MIDVGQAVDIGHPKAREYLSRDVSVVTDFFRRQGVDRCLDTALAEEFVVDYYGPFETDKTGSAEESHSYGRGGGGGPLGVEGDGPPIGLRVLSEVSECVMVLDGEAKRCEGNMQLILHESDVNLFFGGVFSLLKCHVRCLCNAARV